MDALTLEGAIVEMPSRANMAETCMDKAWPLTSFQVCPECKEVKHVSEYYEGNLRRRCKACSSLRGKTKTMIRSGKIAKTGCAMKNDTCDGHIHIHHYNGIDHPAEIIFLCKKHHNEIHREV